MSTDLITQVRDYLDAANSWELAEDVFESRLSAPKRRLLDQRGPVIGIAVAVLVLAASVPLWLFNRGPLPLTQPSVDALDLGVESVWPESGLIGSAEDVAKEFARQAMGWDEATATADPQADPDGPVWVRIVQPNREELSVLTAPILEGRRVLIQIGDLGVSTGPDTTSGGQWVSLNPVSGAESALVHVRLVDPDRVLVIHADLDNLRDGRVTVSDDSPVGSVVVLYLDKEGATITASGGHFGPFQTATDASLSEQLRNEVTALPDFPSELRLVASDGAIGDELQLIASFSAVDGGLVDVVVQRLSAPLPDDVVDPSGTARKTTGPNGESITFVDANGHTIQLIAVDQDGLTVNIIVERINRIDPEQRSSLESISEKTLTEWALILLRNMADDL